MPVEPISNSGVQIVGHPVENLAWAVYNYSLDSRWTRGQSSVARRLNAEKAPYTKILLAQALLERYQEYVEGQIFSVSDGTAQLILSYELYSRLKPHRLKIRTHNGSTAGSELITSTAAVIDSIAVRPEKTIELPELENYYKEYKDFKKSCYSTVPKGGRANLDAWNDIWQMTHADQSTVYHPYFIETLNRILEHGLITPDQVQEIWTKANGDEKMLKSLFTELKIQP